MTELADAQKSANSGNRRLPLNLKKMPHRKNISLSPSSSSSLLSSLSLAPSVCSASTASTRHSLLSSTSGATVSLPVALKAKRTPVAPHFTHSYDLIERIGSKGSFSTVWEARHKETGEHFAVKIIRRSKLSPVDDAAVFEEVKILRFLTRETIAAENMEQQASARTVARRYSLDSTTATTEADDVVRADLALEQPPRPDGGIIKLVDFFVTPNSFYIVTELVKHGDVFDLIVKRGRLLEDDARTLTASLLRAVKILHDRRVAHRDLKPENMLLIIKKRTFKSNEAALRYERRKCPSLPATLLNTALSSLAPCSTISDLTGRSKKDWSSKFSDEFCTGAPNRKVKSDRGTQYEIKIADFGLATFVEKPRSLIERCGTPMYVSPEVLRGEPYDQACDMWSVGVILYFLLSGYPPFMDNQKRDLFCKIISGTFDFDGEGWEGVSAEAKELISLLLTVNPSKRLTAANALDHRWIREMSCC